MKVTLVNHDIEIIKNISSIASICYGKEKAENPVSLVEQLYKNGHHSVFEHCKFTWMIEGLSRAASHQLVRHRMASYTQSSQRYIDESGFAFVLPESVNNNPVATQIYLDTINSINDGYIKLVEMGIKKEDARFLLPNACTTNIVMTCNLREFIHICNERLCLKAQWEIREMVNLMVKSLPEEIQWMCKPKCESGFTICNSPCKEKRKQRKEKRK